MPEGVTISPSSANGLVGCTDEQFALRSADRATCPAASRIGGVEIDTPVLDEVLTGGVYVGRPRSSDPASGDMFRIMVEARGGGPQAALANPTECGTKTVTSSLVAWSSDAPA